ncbi:MULTISPECIES: energy-coupling factor transporter transmembrane component T [unclassified Nocardioides]|uniref:energy-coupling factor transporter transmembrane component T n=1 Tax=unclassified Nocardioides TaxID=2615069 RepID=UPI000702DF9C|nr:MULTISPECIES: energy-coupling factor transporter transmembrane component T [unclassified Nocardioides]KQZ70497.1 cobalt ABC transporter permease [Nocardioides sp. Root151]KRF20767.1 cobalt ABC transporter permease [Nocardioides sp. Soil796]
MRPHHLITYPRALHPGAWWLWAIGLAAAASRTTNPVPLLLIMAVTWFVVSARRGDTPWASSYALFFRLAMLVIVIHLVFQTLLSGNTQGTTVMFTLPEIPLPDSTGIQLGGPVTLEGLLTALYVALQLAAIFCCIGAANALGSARQLLRYVPAALYEIGVACIIALTFAPQLATDARRVRDAARLRGGSRGRIRRFGRLAMPMLEGALERSVALAAAMDSRGYGRTTVSDPRQRRLTSALVVTGMVGVCLGIYGILNGTASSWMGLPALAVGCLLGVAGLVVGGKRTGRTRYRPDPWALPELLVVASGLTAAVLTFWQVRVDPTTLVLASVSDVPPVPMLACAGILVGLLPAFVAPPLPLPPPSRRERDLEVAA